MTKKLLFSALFFLLLNNLFSQTTETTYLSGTDAANTVEWDFMVTDGRNSGEWSTIPVPSNWELHGFGTYNYGHDWKNEDIKLGEEHGLYKHKFEVPQTWKGKTVNIVFDGSMTDTKVKINGVSAGEMHQGAFYRFKYDVSHLLKYGETNLLEVDVAKHSSDESVIRAERQADFWIFGGIFRPVFLEALPAVHMNRTAIDARADGSFNALIVLNKSQADYAIEVELYDLMQNKIGNTISTDVKKGINESTTSGQFNNIKSWNPEWPNLYNMKISLRANGKTLHEVTQRIGFRTVELRPHDGFYVNGEKVVFKGVNRHSFWPETGRALSEENHLTDIRLIKEMNMNSVRMSHYVPDKRFMQLCDSLGLFVMSEVTGWQQGYDTIVGPKLIKETILKDENHPSIVIWNNGNEGGWDFANEKWFDVWDIQKRPVLYPWLLRNGADTHHYPEYNYGIGRNVDGNDPFMATELLHGLYDGGHGAGLEDFWRKYESSPLLAGGFLWVLADEAVLRTDKEGIVFDGDGNNAPDGIVGPHRQKEGSFYTVKEIWSPVQVAPVTINKQWNGRLFLTNKYIYTNLKECSFSWQAVKTEIGSATETVVGSGKVESPMALPNETALVQINTDNALQDADIFKFTAVNRHGMELYTWSWPIVQPNEIAAEVTSSTSSGTEIVVTENSEAIVAKVSTLEFAFDKKNGTIHSVTNDGKLISFSGGPVPAGVESKVEDVTWKQTETGEFEVEIRYSHYPKRVVWTVTQTGLLRLEADAIREGLSDIDFVGITFNYPEEKVKGVKWMGKGPYRVWKNRLKGNNMGVWEKEYNNTITGESFNNLIYPEFKGYHANLYWATLQTTEADFTMISETPNLYFQLFTPDKPQQVAGGTYPPFPKGDLSFLYEIPGIGTKFKQADKLGPKGQKGTYKDHLGDDGYPIKLWFDFR